MTVTRYIVVMPDKTMLAASKYQQMRLTDCLKDARLFTTIDAAKRWAVKLGAISVNVCTVDIENCGVAWENTQQPL